MRVFKEILFSDAIRKIDAKPNLGRVFGIPRLFSGAEMRFQSSPAHRLTDPIVGPFPKSRFSKNAQRTRGGHCCRNNANTAADVRAFERGAASPKYRIHVDSDLERVPRGRPQFFPTI